MRFNARATRLSWLGTYIAWQGFSATPPMATQAPNWSRLTALLGVLDAIYAADDPEGVALPPGVLEPGTLPAAAIDVEGRAVAELAIIATGWALLHEVRHIRHQQDGTFTNPAFDPPGAVRGEERSCDHYATLLLTAKINGLRPPIRGPGRQGAPEAAARRLLRPLHHRPRLQGRLGSD